jgi:hypothetical protein
VNLLITGPLLALLSDVLESNIRASLLKDLKVLEPAFKKEFARKAGRGDESEGECVAGGRCTGGTTSEVSRREGLTPVCLYVYVCMCVCVCRSHRADGGGAVRVGGEAR